MLPSQIPPWIFWGMIVGAVVVVVVHWICFVGRFMGEHGYSQAFYSIIEKIFHPSDAGGIRIDYSTLFLSHHESDIVGKHGG